MGKKIGIAVGIIIVIGFMVFFNLNKGQSDGEGNIIKRGGKAQSVEAQIIKAGEISSSVLVTGRVEEANIKNISSDTPIQILEVQVSDGDRVKKGDVLFTADTSNLKKELDQLLINQEIQSLQLEKLKNASITTDTTSVQIGVELARINYESAKAYYDEQVLAEKNNQLLYDEGLISKSELDAVQKMLRDAKSQLDTAKLNLERSQTEVNNLKKNNKNLSSNTAYDIQVQTKNLESIKLNIDHVKEQIAEIEDLAKAPIDGIVADITIKEQLMSSTLQPMLTIKDVSLLKVTAHIREYDIKDIQLGQAVNITGDAIDAEAIVNAEVSFISPIAKQMIQSGKETTTIDIEMMITEGVSHLKPGYTIDCEITTKMNKNALIASYNMFREDKDGGKIVLKVDENNQVVEQPVKLGITSYFDAEIVEGLESGDIVINNPSLSLKEGTTVRITNDLMEEGE